MEKRIVFVGGMLAALALCHAVAADVRVNIRLGPGHPLRRPARIVVVRPARPGAVVFTGRVVYVAPVVWRRAVVPLPPRDRLVWEDNETLHRREDWVDTTLHVHNRGEALYLRVGGRAQIDFAEVQFGNGQVQVVDFQEGALEPGIYTLLDFPGSRDVHSVRLVGRARTPQTRLTVLMRK